MTKINSDAPIAAPPITVIRPNARTWPMLTREVFRHRHLLARLVRRHLQLRYDDLLLGMFWVVARPLLMVAVFVFIKNMSQARVGIDIPYSLYLLSGLALWFYFIEATQAAANSGQVNAALIRKIYYPRIINPLVPVCGGVGDLLVGAVPLALLMLWFGKYPGWNIVLLPVVIGQCMALAFGIGCLFATLRLQNRDWERFLSLVLYVGLFVSPVIYSPSIIPERALAIFNANPMSGTLLALRSVLFDDQPFPTETFLYSCGFTAAVLVIGIYCFARAEKIMLDRI